MNALKLVTVHALWAVADLLQIVQGALIATASKVVPVERPKPW